MPPESRGSPERLAWLTALGVAGLVVVNVLAAAYPHDPVAAGDVDVARWVGSSLPVWVEWLARPFAWLGGGIGLAAVGLLAAIILARRGRVVDASLVALSYVGAQLSTQLLKAATDRPRPSFDPAVPLPGSSAFPSGHASATLAVLVLAAVLLRLGRWWITACLAMTAAVGLSRIALGVHWTSDVVAGWALGVAWLAGCLLARETPWVNRRPRSRRFRGLPPGGCPRQGSASADSCLADKRSRELVRSPR